MKTNRLTKTLLAALLLAAAPAETHAASLLGDGTFDNLSVGTAPTPGQPAGRWFLHPNNSSRWERSPEGISIAPSPAGGTGNALRYNLSANYGPGTSVDVYNTLARPVTAASGEIIDMSFDIYIEPGSGGPSLILGTDGRDDKAAVQLTWGNDGRVVTWTPAQTTLVDAYPRGVWQTVRLKVDLVRQRYDFDWSEKGQPASVTRSNLTFHSPTPVLSLNQLAVIRFVSLTWAVQCYIDNIQISAGPPAAVTPAHSFVAPGGSLTLSPTNTLAVPSIFQWQFHGTNLPGATSATLALNNLSLDQSGPYSVVVSNAFEVVTATPARVEVVDRVTIVRSPISTNLPAGSNVTLRVTAVSPSPITYQWQFNGVDLPGQTGATLALTNVQIAQEGLYTVVATDALRSVTSEPASLVVLARPVIVQAPLSQSVVAGGSVTFSTEITGNPAPFLYQWRLGSTILTNVVQAGKKAFFTLNNVQTNQAGTYRLNVTNAAATTLNITTTCILTVLPDTDGDGLPDAWETAHGLSSTDATDAALDLDGDGHSNATEYRSGTSPTDAASCLKLEGITQSNGTATVSFNAASNQTYTVEWCAQPDGSAWSKLTDLIARPNTRTETVTDGTATDAARFYRVVTPRKP